MNARDTDKSRKPSAAARAEAAAWIARLHGPNRTPEVEAGFRRWMADDSERAAAFELLTDTWDKAARLRRRPFEQVTSRAVPGFRLSLSRAALAATAVACAAVVATVFYLRTDAVATAVGEQRTLTLEDGTRVYLNTNTRAVVHYDKSARRVELNKGEAMFEVAKRPEWPFIVDAGLRQIRALGTSFVVRRDEQTLAVTLVEGRVTVSPSESPIAAVPAASELADRPSNDTVNADPRQISARGKDASVVGGSERVRPAARDATAVERIAGNSVSPSGKAELMSPALDVIVLYPGQRITFAGDSAPKVDRPALERLTAWQRGRVALDNTPLADAVAEMNRYSDVQIVLQDPDAATLRVSGIFRAGDSESFSEAVAKTYQLRRRDGAREIILTGKPSLPDKPSNVASR
jgi:transmembrane sensor